MNTQKIEKNVLTPEAVQDMMSYYFVHTERILGQNPTPQEVCAKLFPNHRIKAQ